MPYQPKTGQCPISDANRIGLDYAYEAGQFAYAGPIYDVHTHLNSVKSARMFMDVARQFGVVRAWSMSPLEIVDQLKQEHGDKIEFIAVPRYDQRDDPSTFTTRWLRRIEGYAEQGTKICKFWAAPRGADFLPEPWIDSAIRCEGMKLARSLGMMFMFHVGDPDTWFATKYSDASKYLTKDQHVDRLERVLGDFGDVPIIGAHMGGLPEHLDRLADLLDRYPNYYVDTSATKWQVRELSKRTDELVRLCQAYPGRILFGTDLVTNDDNMDFDHYASRFWALRTLMETDYDGPSPIVDPDLHMCDPAVDEKSTAHLVGASMAGDALSAVYVDAASKLLDPLYDRQPLCVG